MPVKRLARKGVELDEPILRLAETLAQRYDVSVQALFEALVLGCAEREPDLRAAWASLLPLPPVESSQVPVEARRRRRPGSLVVLSGGRTCSEPPAPRPNT